ncbi:Protein of unknown function [Bacillus mycoides]|nr:Protein of unknown function [Bacillus mycoides]
MAELSRENLESDIVAAEGTV